VCIKNNTDHQNKLTDALRPSNTGQGHTPVKMLVLPYDPKKKKNSLSHKREPTGKRDQGEEQWGDRAQAKESKRETVDIVTG
jgi:hypothetical protein